MNKFVGISLAICASIFLISCQKFSIASKGWTQIDADGDIVTAQCDFASKTIKVDGKIVHWKTEFKPLKIGHATIACDTEHEILVISYQK